VVASISADKMEELFLIRSRLEGLAAYLACKSFRKSDLKTLRGLLAQMSKLARMKDAANWLKANEKWHHFIFRKSGKEQLEQLLLELWNRGMSRRLGAPTLKGTWSGARESIAKFSTPSSGVRRNWSSDCGRSTF